jgi:hypothetical protein
MAVHRFAIVLILGATLSGCGKSTPDPKGVWTVRHELKQKSPETGESTVVGFSTSTITIKDDGTFQETMAIELFEDPDPDPTEYKGKWKQDADVIRFRRDGEDSTGSYSIDEQGLRMTGNVAGHSIVLTRQLEADTNPE